MTDRAFDRGQHPAGATAPAAAPVHSAYATSSPMPPGVEAELTAGFRVEPGQAWGFFTDTSICIGCKACEVACKEWNALPADDVGFTPTSYDQTRALSARTWRHVKFVEQAGRDGAPPRWLFLSDICKHCAQAPCLESCPTGAIARTEYGSVLIQQGVRGT
jgi:formate dehydrogenase iron-sulfur subunit